MLDKFLGVGASLDWVSPLASLFGDLVNGPSHTFLIPYFYSPLSGREIQWMLGKRGVRTWGAMVVSGTLMVSVRLSQARYAAHLLDQAGVPIENAPEGQATAARTRTRATRSDIVSRSRILQRLKGGRR